MVLLGGFPIFRYSRQPQCGGPKHYKEIYPLVIKRLDKRGLYQSADHSGHFLT